MNAKEKYKERINQLNSVEWNIEKEEETCITLGKTNIEGKIELMLDDEAENNLKRIKDVTLKFFYKEAVPNSKVEYYIECNCQNIKITLDITIFQTAVFESVHLIKNDRIFHELKEEEITYFKQIVFQIREAILSKKEYRLRQLLGQLKLTTNLERSIG